jgi:predicted O-methyltransferase YrrM
MNPMDPLQQLEELAAGFQKSQILFTALRAGLFDLLKSAPTAENVAAQNGWTPRTARMLLDGLVAIDLATKEDGRYRNGDAVRACLIDGAPNDQRHIMLHRANAWEGWSHLEAALRAGGAPRSAKSDHTPESLRAFILGMADTGRTSAAAMLNLIDLRGRKHMLDIGTGPGTYPITFMKACPELRATLFDLPEVIPITREQVDAAGMGHRVRYLPGDLATTALGSGYDFIHLSNIVHMLSPGTNAALVQRCYHALDPGGMLLIKDFLTEPDRPGPPFSLLFALHMLVHTPEGDVYTRADAQAWTDAAGFAPGCCLDLTPSSRLWLVQKPG